MACCPLKYGPRPPPTALLLHAAPLLLLLLLLLLHAAPLAPRSTPLTRFPHARVPEQEGLSSAAAEETCGFAFKHPPQPEEAGALTKEDEAMIETVTQLFKEHVDTTQLVADLTEASANPGAWVRELPSFPDTEERAGGAAKRPREDA